MKSSGDEQKISSPNGKSDEKGIHADRSTVGNPYTLLSEGISPVQGAAKMDHVKTGRTQLEVQFNVVTAEALREAQREPEKHRHLIVRVPGYSDYFCDLSVELQEEIIARTEHDGF